MKKSFNALIVEDNENDLQLLLLRFRREGITLNYVCVEEEKTYLEALDNQTWDIILADYALPNFSGIKALELLKQRAVDIPFIIVSGTIGEDVAVECMKSGARDYILKNNMARLPQSVIREIDDARLRLSRTNIIKTLETKENLLTAIADHSPTMIAVRDTEGALLLANTQLHNIVLKQTDSPTAAGHSTPNTAQTYREDLTHKDGSVHTYLTVKFPLMGPEHNPIAYGQISTDISEQLEIEKHNIALERQLNSAHRMEAIGHLTGGIAHDFNNILTMIIGYNTLVKLKLQANNSDEEINSYLEQIDAASSRAKELVSQMLAFSKSEDIELCEISLKKTINQTLQLLHSILPSSIKVHLDYDQDIEKIHGNIVQIQQMLINLVINARDAMKNTGTINITVKNSTKNSASYCDSCHEAITGPFFTVNIKDNGSGIEEENLKRIFTPFFTTKEVGKGTGMGLSVVHGIMHKMEGHIQVTSKKGQGTEFNLFFPALTSNVESLNNTQKDESLTGA